jgi:hypothetical protein
MKLTKFPTTRLTRERPLSEDQCGSVASLLRTVREMKLTKFPTTRLTRQRSPTVSCVAQRAKQDSPTRPLSHSSSRASGDTMKLTVMFSPLTAVWTGNGSRRVTG